jgi:hypothetical protein
MSEPTSINPLLSLQVRVREILKGTGAFEKILIEDKEGIAYLIERAIASWTGTCVIIGSVEGEQERPVPGALLLRETLSVMILHRPLVAGAPGAPLPSDLLCTLLYALHEAPLDAENTAPGAPFFRVTGHRLEGAQDGLVSYSITLTAPLVLVIQPPLPPEPPEEIEL